MLMKSNATYIDQGDRKVSIFEFLEYKLITLPWTEAVVERLSKRTFDASISVTTNRPLFHFRDVRGLSPQMANASVFRASFAHQGASNKTSSPPKAVPGATGAQMASIDIKPSG